MPHHPAEENTGGNLTDKVAKENPADSNASTHDMHKEDSDATSGGLQGKATAMDHMSKGPVISDNIGEPASKEDLKARAAELNK
ncbi:hypothetical protein K490DRAFT_69911 [Saccharata proteae CBS 121410]|uniref:Uncharacterized protein n=1 Tax=Saccharata proteae CBS 121410 TaxID=1314787 RepID=A0A9P4HMJ7_9PEZI|nr:hypothetical protein K490DRAFT_69911 [Saccharata proteae CBS 121410]